MTLSAYIPPGSKVMTPSGRTAIVVRYVPDSGIIQKERAICRYLDDNDTVNLLPELLKEID